MIIIFILPLGGNVKILDEKLDFSKKAKPRTNTGLEVVYVKTNGRVSQSISDVDYLNEESILSDRTNSTAIGMLNNKPKNAGLVIYDIAENDNEEKVSQSDEDLDGKGNENEHETEPEIEHDNKKSEENDMTAKLYQIILPNGTLISGTTFVKS